MDRVDFIVGMDEDECKSASDVEVDSDNDDRDAERELGNWLGQFDTLKMALNSDGTDTGTVRRRNKTVVTPKMAMESFRLSFLNNEESQDVNLDAILGELCELESQLNTTQTGISKSLDPPSTPTPGPNHLSDATFPDVPSDPIQAELDALAAEITKGLGFNTDDFFGMSEELGSLLPDSGLDVTETDSAYSDNASLPSSESFTSMATVSSSADTSSTGDACSTGSTSTLTPASTLNTDAHARVLARLCTVQDELYRDGQVSPEEQKARLQAEKIRIALEKIKEAKIKKLFVRAFGRDGSSKSILVDEKMTVGHVCNILADKNHMKLSPDLAVVEYIPDLYIERILEDHDSLVENMVMWARDSKNKILFEDRAEKNDLFKNPEKYLLLGTSSEKGISLDPNQREKLLQEFFSGSGLRVPEVESVLYLKSDGKKAWKKFFFVLRASGLYYNPKGKFSKAAKDLTCLVQFDYVDVYHGIGWKKKYHAPTDYCFALKHPQIQKKTSKYIRYLCAENKSTIDLWIMGIRIAKYGKQLLTNYERLLNDISTWDSRNITNNSSGHYEPLPLKTANLQDSRMSIPPELSSRLSLVTMKNATLSRNRTLSSTTDCDNPDDVVIEVTPMQPRKSSISGPIMIDSPQKAPVKRVSFSNTHCIINADPGEELVPMKHRDSITSASTDSSEESNSSGESKTVSGTSLRGRMKPKLPVTTGTTRQISEMVQMAMEDRAQVLYESIMEEKKPTSPYGHLDKPMERRKSAPAIHDEKREVHKHERKPSEGNCIGNNKPDPRMLSHYSSMSQAASTTPPPQKPVGQVPPLVGKHVGQVPPSPPFSREEIYMKKMNGPPLTPPPVASKPCAPSVPPPTPPIHHQKLNQVNSHGHHPAQSPAGQISVAVGRKMLMRADSESAAGSPGRAPLCISGPMSSDYGTLPGRQGTPPSECGRGPVSISGPMSSDYGTLPGRQPVAVSGPKSSDYGPLPGRQGTPPSESLRGQVTISGPMSSDYGTLPGRQPVLVSGPKSSDYGPLPGRQISISGPMPSDYGTLPGRQPVLVSGPRSSDYGPLPGRQGTPPSDGRGHVSISGPMSSDYGTLPGRQPGPKSSDYGPLPGRQGTPPSETGRGPVSISGPMPSDYGTLPGRQPVPVSGPKSSDYGPLPGRQPGPKSSDYGPLPGRQPAPVSISGPIPSDYGTLPGRQPVHISGPVSSSDYAPLPGKKEPICVPVPTAPGSDYAPTSIVRGNISHTSPVPPPMPGVPTDSASVTAIPGRPPVSTNPQASALPAHPSPATIGSTTKMPLAPPQPNTPTQSPSMPPLPPMPPQMPLLHIAPMGPPPVAPPPPPQPTVKMGPPPPPPAVKPNKIPQPPQGSPVPPPMPSCAPPIPGQVSVRPPPISLLAHTKKTALADTNGTPLSINVNNKEPPMKNEALSPNSQSSLPFLEELSKRSLKPKPQVGPPTAAKPSQALREHAIRSVEQAAKAQAQANAQVNNTQYQQSRQGLAKALALETQGNRIPACSPPSHPTHQRTHSDGKKPPPPPPKRSESTKLSTDNVKALRTANADDSGVPEALNDNGSNGPIMTIGELPPPPPDFLEGLASDGSSLKKGRPPPPPPKRSKETQLTHH